MAGLSKEGPYYNKWVQLTTTTLKYYFFFFFFCLTGFRKSFNNATLVECLADPASLQLQTWFHLSVSCSLRSLWLGSTKIMTFVTEWKLQSAIILTAFVRQIWVALTHSTNINPLNAIVQDKEVFLFFCLSLTRAEEDSLISPATRMRNISPQQPNTGCIIAYRCGETYFYFFRPNSLGARVGLSWFYSEDCCVSLPSLKPFVIC